MMIAFGSLTDADLGTRIKTAQSQLYADLYGLLPRVEKLDALVDEAVNRYPDRGCTMCKSAMGSVRGGLEAAIETLVHMIDCKL